MSWLAIGNWFFLACCTYALIAFGLHWLLRGAACSLDAAAELLGHPLHSLSMINMLLVMVRVMPAFIASSFWVSCFLLCAAVFGLRLFQGRMTIWWHDALDLMFALSMAYMWISPLDWPPALTTGICLMCIGTACVLLRRFKMRESVRSPARANLAAFLATSGHVVLLTTMLAMFVIMQPGHLVTAPGTVKTNAAACVEAMPGMRMCP